MLFSSISIPLIKFSIYIDFYIYYIQMASRMNNKKEARQKRGTPPPPPPPPRCHQSTHTRASAAGCFDSSSSLLPGRTCTLSLLVVNRNNATEQNQFSVQKRKKKKGRKMKGNKETAKSASMRTHFPFILLLQIRIRKFLFDLIIREKHSEKD